MKTVLKYPGAKNRLADWICSFIPAHNVYFEPYFGSGGVFFNKEPSRIETINDIDSNVVNYFKVLRTHPYELAKAIGLTPYARDEYLTSFETNEIDSDIEKARKFAVRCWQGIGNSNTYYNGFRSTQQTSGPRTAIVWGNLPEKLIQAGNRLLLAQIENIPAVELIKRYNTPDVFIYCDPPYLCDTRTSFLYKYEMTDEQHEELLSVLASHPGKVLLSGYDNKLYNSYLTGWNKVQKKTQAEAGIFRVETLWMNYEAMQMSLKL